MYFGIGLVVFFVIMVYGFVNLQNILESTNLFDPDGVDLFFGRLVTVLFALLCGVLWPVSLMAVVAYGLAKIIKSKMK